LQFCPAEAQYVEELMAEYLELGLPCDMQWFAGFEQLAQELPNLCGHLHQALPACERQVAIALQGSYENHLRAVQTALFRCAAH
jgi:hypothetical protein